MNELTRPFIRMWDYAGQVGGYPGQAFLAIVVVMVIILTLTWFGNRR